MPNNPSQFYGGQGRSLGRVAILPIKSWSQFIKDVLSHPQMLNVTRDQYAKLDKDSRASAKRVNYVTPATFNEDDAKRTYEFAKDISLVCLDIDDPKIAAPFVHDPDLLSARLDPYAFAAYETASSTATQPKLRIMVPAAHIPTKLYRTAVRLIAAKLGIANFKGIKESSVCVQPMYLPTIFKNEDPAESSPMLCALLNGDALSKADCLVEGAEPADGDGKSVRDSSSDDIMFLKATQDDVSIEDVAEALKFNDPDCDRHEWMRTAAALKHQWPKDDAAYELFDAWSARGKKYEGSEDTQAMWDSTKPTPAGREPVTVLTIFKKARDAGWAGSTKEFQHVLKWIRDPERTVEELQGNGPTLISRLRNCTALQLEQLLGEVQTFLKKQGIKVSMPALRKTIRSARSRASNPNANGDEEKMPKWAQGLVFVSDNNEFYNRSTKGKFSCDALDNACGIHLMSKDGEGSRPSARPRDYLLNVLQISRVSSYRYDPKHPESTIVHDEGGQRFVNLYLPTYPEPDADDACYAGAIMERHLENLIAEPKYRRHLMDFFAYQVQNPGKKIRWAALIQGAEGCGKTATARMMATVLGKSNVAFIDAAHLFSQFNPWAMGSQLVALEEVRVVGYNRYDVMNRLKSCISNDTINVNDKGKKLIEAPNMTNYMLFTNHHDSLAVGSNDRRYFVLNSAIQNKEQVRALGPKYFKRLFRVIDRHGPGLRSWLENHVISEDFAANGHAPRTKYLATLHDAASTPLTAAVNEVLSSPDTGNIQVRKDIVNAKELRMLLELDTGLRNLNDHVIGTALRELGYEKAPPFKIRGAYAPFWFLRGTRQNTADMVELARQRFEKKFRLL